MTKAGHVIHLTQKRGDVEVSSLKDAEFEGNSTEVPKKTDRRASDASTVDRRQSSNSGKWDASQGERRNLATRPWANIPSDRRQGDDSEDDALVAQPDKDEVRSALKSVLASPEFRSVPQLRAFLNYVVCAVLDNRVDEIKGYTIAVEALGRDPSFNPVTDPIVRVEAARLRRRLSDFYDGSGTLEHLRISIPKGSYVPEISMQAHAEHSRRDMTADIPAETAGNYETAISDSSVCGEKENQTGQSVAKPTDNRPPVEAFLQRHIVTIACLASFLLGFVIGRI